MRLKPIIFSILLLSAAMAAGAADASHPLDFTNVPAAAQTTINRQVNDGKLAGINQANLGGENVFEVSYTTKTGDEQDFTVSDDGTLLSVEVPLAATPAAVQQTIRLEVTGWEIESIDKNVDDTEITYDVSATKGERKRDFTVTAGGRLLSLVIQLTNAPVPVQTAIKSQIADGSLKAIDENFDPEGNTFNVEFLTKEGDRQSVCVATDGQLLSKEVTLQECPQRVRQTIQETIGGGKILRIDKSLFEKTDGILPYEVQGRKDGKPFEFSVGPRGKFLGMDN
jgi:hypothetical protein